MFYCFILFVLGMVNVIVEEVFYLFFFYIIFKEMFIFLKKICDKINEGKIDVVVLIYGMDILEEIVYFLDLIVYIDILIVLIGVMRLSNEIGLDGFYNFIFVVWVVISDGVKGKGVLVVMNDEIYIVENVIKIYISNVVIF